jgi:serine/threonine protein kinase
MKKETSNLGNEGTLNSNGDGYNEKITKKIVCCLQYEIQTRLHEGICFQHRTANLLPQLERDDLEVGNLLGEGGFAEVWELISVQKFDSSDDSIYEVQRRQINFTSKPHCRKDCRSGYVLKQLGTKFLRKPEHFRVAAHDLIMEAHFLACLQHPHIISIQAVAKGGALSYKSGHINGFFFIMDRIEMTLRQRIQQWSKQLMKFKKEVIQKLYGPNMTEFVLYVGRLQAVLDISSAVAYLHDRFVMHRDIKAENIGIDRNGRVKLLDFGLAVEWQLNTSYRHRRAGSPRYMAPENYLRKPYDQSIDIYALALLLWEVLALKACFEDVKEYEFGSKVMERGYRPALDKAWPEECRKLMQQGWTTIVLNRPDAHTFYDRLLQEVVRLKSLELCSNASTWKVNGESCQTRFRVRKWIKNLWKVVPEVKSKPKID